MYEQNEKDLKDERNKFFFILPTLKQLIVISFKKDYYYYIIFLFEKIKFCSFMIHNINYLFNIIISIYSYANIQIYKIIVQYYLKYSNILYNITNIYSLYKLPNKIISTNSFIIIFHLHLPHILISLSYLSTPSFLIQILYKTNLFSL